MEWGPISIGVTVGLTVMLILVGRRGIKAKKPTWAYTTRKLIDRGTHTPKELQLTFKGKPVDEVYQTTFIFFNRGRETIHSADITQPITIHFPKGKILRQPARLEISNGAIKCSAKRAVKDGKHQVKLDFLYLYHEDGAVFEVLHTEQCKLDCTGNIMGAKKIVNAGAFKTLTRPHMVYRIGLFAMFCGFTGWAIYSYLTSPLDESWLYRGLIIALGGMLATFIPEVRNCFRFLNFPRWSRTQLQKTAV